MPPKRKSPRKPAAVASPAAQVAAGFAKPNLPPLKGTPSARRQYTYGAAVEPPAPRAVQTRRGKLLDLNSAVQNVLEDLDENYDDVGDANVEAQDTPAAAQITPPAPRQPRSTGQGDSRGATPTPSPRKLKTREIVPEIEILSATREIVPEILSDDEDMLSPAAAPRKLKTRKIVPEILSDDEDMRSFAAAPRKLKTRKIVPEILSDDEDMRSFAAESDFYEAASMRLSVEPETPRVYEDANEPFVADAVPRRSTLGLHMHPSPLRQSVELDDDEDEESPIQTKPPSL
ncbi:hypothetical protein CDD82_301 [Ophiocordyceps australis]|uniref:Uncharacterized protein n=1 Tax=Ophiocordyceps australis TaxID=1399860 RepID=A0A2C5XDS8_9HYPO|nr:hypothetical protein CDD82_301 [Ophiocordyceps australis]